MTKPKPLTTTQLKILRNVRDYGDPTARGFYGLQQHGGAGISVQSLLRRGLIEYVREGQGDRERVTGLGLTEDGKTALEQA
jgi:hypothetical protein